MPKPDPALDTQQSGWIEPVLWSLIMVACIVIAACVNETAREVVLQGVAYLLSFLSTPFVLEASAALTGLCIVLIINHRRMAKEGDGWVVMEIKKEEPKTDDHADDEHSKVN